MRWEMQQPAMGMYDQPIHQFLRMKGVERNTRLQLQLPRAYNKF